MRCTNQFESSIEMHNVNNCICARMFTDDILLLLPQTYDIKRNIWRTNKFTLCSWTRFYFQRATKVTSEHFLTRMSHCRCRTITCYSLFDSTVCFMHARRARKVYKVIEMHAVRSGSKLATVARLFPSLKHIFVEFFSWRRLATFSLHRPRQWKTWTMC